MSTRKNSQLRTRIAQECARIMLQERLDDYALAKAKAAARLGVPQTRDLPANREIAEAILEYRRIFDRPAESGRLAEQRRTAVAAMQMLQDFSPRLTGSVLHGTAHSDAEIQLHVFSDSPEEIAFFLMERNIPYHLKERRFYSLNKSYPAYRFMAGREAVMLTVFPFDGLRRPPPDPLDGKPMRRADLAAVLALTAA